MFVYSIRSATIKFICAIVLSVAVLITLVAFIPTYDKAEPTASITYSKITDNEARLNFISQFGWNVKDAPLEEVNVVIPREFDKVYLGYNEMQKEQGLNLSKYKGKTVTRYTYEVTNYPNYDDTVYISLLVYKDKVIGGDVCSADVNGFVHGFSSPESKT